MSACFDGWEGVPALADEHVDVGSIGDVDGLGLSLITLIR